MSRLGLAFLVLLLGHNGLALAGRTGQSPNGLDKDQQWGFWNQNCTPRVMANGEMSTGYNCMYKTDTTGGLPNVPQGPSSGNPPPTVPPK